MPDWTKSMQQSFEYYTVNPNTWGDMYPITTVKKCSIERDSGVDTLGSASFEIDEDITETYVRVYLVTIQNGVKERFALGTFLIENPSIKFDGIKMNRTMDAYTPLIELKENQPDLGYTLLKNENILNNAYQIIMDHSRCQTIKVTDISKTLTQNFVSNTDDTWMTFVKDLLKNAEYHIELDETGRVIMAPDIKIEAMQPKWTYDTGNSSILYSDIDIARDLYGVPNVVHVIYSQGSTSTPIEAIIENNDEDNQLSIKSRGRRIVYREVNPSALIGVPSQGQVTAYAKQLLKNKSTVEYEVSYKHGYCPVTIGDCVRINCPSIGLDNVKALVTSQSIDCTPGTPVSETAIFTKELWRPE